MRIRTLLAAVVVVVTPLVGVAQEEKEKEMIVGQQAATELEQLYKLMFTAFLNGESETTISELIQVHRMAIEARELGGTHYKKLQQDWRPAAKNRAKELTRVAERQYKAGNLSLTAVRLARANEKLTEARQLAEVRAAEGRRATTNARRRSVNPPTPR